jgi:hypothetical protein
LSDAALPSDAGTSPPTTFVPVRLASDAPVIEIVLNGGERLRIGAGASPALVQAVVTTLRARC